MGETHYQKEKKNNKQNKNKRPKSAKKIRNERKRNKKQQKEKDGTKKVDIDEELMNHIGQCHNLMALGNIENEEVEYTVNLAQIIRL